MKNYMKEYQVPVINNRTIAKSCSFNEEEILLWIMKLYCPEGIELDPTYRSGLIYKNIRKPKLKFDLNPITNDCQRADCRNLPIDDDTISSILFDPPFLIRNTLLRGKKTALICKSFSHFSSYQESIKMYCDSLKEFHRILKNKGILIFKCQDIVHGNRQIFYHVDIINISKDIGFEPLDLFIRLNKAVPIKNKYHKQNFARKFHCYYLVFKKR